MKISKRIATFFLSIMMLFSCFFFTSCADLNSVHGSYHLIQVIYNENDQQLIVNLDPWAHLLPQSSYCKLDLQEDGRAEFRSKSEEVETILRGSWSVADDGSIHLLFEDQLTIATLDGRYLILENETSKATFKKVLFDFTESYTEVKVF